MFTIVLLHAIPVFLVAYYTKSIKALNLAAFISGIIGVLSGSPAYLIYDLVGIGIAYSIGRSFIVKHSPVQVANTLVPRLLGAPAIAGVMRAITNLKTFSNNKRLDFELYRLSVWPFQIDSKCRREIVRQIEMHLRASQAWQVSSFVEYSRYVNSAYPIGAATIVLNALGAEKAQNKLGSDRYHLINELISRAHELGLLGDLARVLHETCRAMDCRVGKFDADRGPIPANPKKDTHVTSGLRGNAATEQARVATAGDRNKRISGQGSYAGLTWGSIFSGIFLLVGFVVFLAVVINKESQTGQKTGSTGAELSSEVRGTVSPQKPSAQATDVAIIQEIQKRLGAMAYKVGPVDGIAGHRTRAAIMQFQRDFGFPINGNPDARVLSELRRNGQCIRKTVMSDRDYRRCGLEPPTP